MTSSNRNGGSSTPSGLANRALSSPRLALTDLPIINIEPFLRDSSRDDRLRTAHELRSACIDMGFFYLVGHEFAVSDLNTVLQQGKRFFASPTADKMRIAALNVDMPGYIRTGGINPEKNRDNVVDLKERFSMSRDLIENRRRESSSAARPRRSPSTITGTTVLMLAAVATRSLFATA